MIIKRKVYVGGNVDNIHVVKKDLESDRLADVHIVFISPSDQNIFEILSHKEYLKFNYNFEGSIVVGIAKNRNDAINIIVYIIEKVLGYEDGNNIKSAVTEIFNE